MTQSTVVINNTETNVAEVANNTTLTVHDETERTVEVNTGSIVDVTSNATPTTLEVGIMGPQGRPGTSEDEIMYSKRVDFIDDSTLYRGEAVPGSSESESVWRIRKITIAADNDVTETWADGNDNFDKAWSDRAGLSYV